MKNLIGKELKLQEMPQSRFGDPDVTIGNYYKIIDVDGSNVWFMDDSGHKTSCGVCRFEKITV
jgi:hypothetical protein